MKSKLILFYFLIIIQTTVLGQTSELKRGQIHAIQQLINVFKTNNKIKIAESIDYPLRREYPLKDVKNKTDFIQRFDQIFDKDFINHVANSKIKDWAEVGWRGIMFDNGTIWIDDNGKITSINYQSPKEKELLAHSIHENKSQLPKSLQSFEKPMYLIITKNYKIRIDQMSEGIYRYAAWKIKNQKSEPEVVIENGALDNDGSGGNEKITFKKNEFTYVVYINEVGEGDFPDASLEVRKGEQTILTENGRIKRN
jgi:hypothetical protein